MRREPCSKGSRRTARAGDVRRRPDNSLPVNATPAHASASESWARVGTTGTIHYIAPYCTATGVSGSDYSDLSHGGRACYYGNAKRHAEPRPRLRPQGRIRICNGVLIIADRFRTQCFAGANLCTTGDPGTAWYRVTSTGNSFVSQTFETGGMPGVSLLLHDDGVVQRRRPLALEHLGHSHSVVSFIECSSAAKRRGAFARAVRGFFASSPAPFVRSSPLPLTRLDEKRSSEPPARVRELPPFGRTGWLW